MAIVLTCYLTTLQYSITPVLLGRNFKELLITYITASALKLR